MKRGLKIYICVFASCLIGYSTGIAQVKYSKAQKQLLKEANYYFNSIPFPKLHGPDPEKFYQELLKVHNTWQKELEPAMKIQLPEERIENFCKHSLVREMITRSRNHPRYGFIDGYKQHGCGWMVIDCVQPTFNSTVSAHLEWGMFKIAREYLYDYYEKYVYDDA